MRSSLEILWLERSGDCADRGVFVTFASAHPSHFTHRTGRRPNLERQPYLCRFSRSTRSRGQYSSFSIACTIDYGIIFVPSTPSLGLSLNSLAVFVLLSAFSPTSPPPSLHSYGCRQMTISPRWKWKASRILSTYPKSRRRAYGVTMRLLLCWAKNSWRRQTKFRDVRRRFRFLKGSGDLANVDLFDFAVYTRTFSFVHFCASPQALTDVPR